MFQQSSQNTAIIRYVSLNCSRFINMSLQIQSVTLAGTSNEMILKQIHSNTLKSLAMGQILKTELSAPKSGFPTIVLLVYDLILQYKVGQQSWTYFSRSFFLLSSFSSDFSLFQTLRCYSNHILFCSSYLCTSIFKSTYLFGYFLWGKNIAFSGNTYICQKVQSTFLGVSDTLY